MLTLPAEIIAVLAAFAPLFSQPVSRHAQILLIGAILTPGTRTVANALRVMGLSRTQRFQNYHRVLNRAKWNSHKAAKILLDRLVRTFVPAGTVVIGIDETLERRRGEKIAAKGIYRDAVRSSKNFFVKSSGLLCCASATGLDQSDAAGADSLGCSGLGTAVPVGSGPLRALC